MIYLVSGFQMTGTALMMESLIAGGMDAAWSKDKDDLLNERFGKLKGMTLNESYYELDSDEYRKPGFPKSYDGKLIKVLYGGLPTLDASLQYHVIYMRRPQGEVVQNLAKIYGMKGVGNASRPNFTSKQDKAIAWMKDRPGQFLSVDEIWYGDVLNDPLAVFQKLADYGWPIDPKKAATTQEPLATAL